MINIAKILNDKYYTSPELAEYCVKKTEEIIGKENITEYLEPSAGNGVFLNYLPKGTLAYDIEPEDDRVVKQDYLTLDLEYKQGRCVIGNPPFGERNVLAVKFYKQSIKFGDYISFILPISQLNNNQQMYEFDLIHSEDLIYSKYSGVDLHCCLNIYKKNNNNKPIFKLKDIKIRQSRKRNGIVPNIEIKDYDIAFCIRGGSIGKICNNLSEYNDIILLKCLDESKKAKVLKSINGIKAYFTNDISARSVKSWQIIKYLKEQIEGIE